ncbi:MAG: hypothetical protein LKI57_02260 [Acetobacter lovaniensis]|jgi:hypothetical protein|nr:hypothetical protein [Acetobacter lovaniensis]
MVYRIDDVTAVSALPALPTDNIGEPGFFTGGSTTGQSPTRVRFWWLNMVQEELINIAQAAGIVFDKTKNDQCITAIKQLISDVASSAVMGTPGVLADGDVAGKLLYYAANQKAPVFVYGTTTVALVSSTALVTVLQGFLPLVGGNVTGAMDWGSKTVASTVTHRFWSAGPPAEGDAAPDATLTIAGGTPGTANKGTMALSTGVFDLSETGQVLVPSILIFGGKDALNALTAEGRYVKSVPVAPNKRITDIWENADGRLVFGDGTTAPILASLSDLPLDPGQQIQTFVVSGDNSGIVTTKFPVAFKAGTVPRVLLRINNEPNSNAWTRVAHIALDANYNEVIDNTGFTWAATYFTSNSAGNSAVQFTLTVMAIGERQ